MYSEKSFQNYIFWTKVRRLFLILVLSTIGCLIGIFISDIVKTITLEDNYRKLIISISTLVFFSISLLLTIGTAREVQDGYWKMAVLRKLTVMSKKLDNLENLTNNSVNKIIDQDTNLSENINNNIKEPQNNLETKSSDTISNPIDVSITDNIYSININNDDDIINKSEENKEIEKFEESKENITNSDFDNIVPNFKNKIIDIDEEIETEKAKKKRTIKNKSNK